MLQMAYFNQLGIQGDLKHLAVHQPNKELVFTT